MVWVKFQQAAAIGKYVEAIRSTLSDNSIPIEELEQWTKWALAQADRIDPASVEHS